MEKSTWKKYVEKYFKKYVEKYMGTYVEKLFFYIFVHIFFHIFFPDTPDSTFKAASLHVAEKGANKKGQLADVMHMLRALVRPHTAELSMGTGLLSVI